MTGLLCLLGLHRGLWMPVVSIVDGDSQWLQLRRCVNCGRIIGGAVRG